MYSSLNQKKVIKEAALRSGVSQGVMQACWDAAGEVEDEDNENENQNENGGGTASGNENQNENQGGNLYSGLVCR